MVPLASDPVGSIGYQMLGLTHSAISYLIEQLPGAKNAEQYILKHHEKSEKSETEIETTSGCARGNEMCLKKIDSVHTTLNTGCFDLVSDRVLPQSIIF